MSALGLNVGMVLTNESLILVEFECVWVVLITLEFECVGLACYDGATDNASGV